jgi:hypothetical protein
MTQVKAAHLTGLGLLCVCALIAVGRLEAQGPKVIAYDVPAGMIGNQDYDGALGMDFDVQLDILITRIGVFDSGSDGLAVPITARLFDRDAVAEIAVVEFTPDDPGDLVGGSRFKALDMDVPAGFHGTIVASGYGALELNGNGFSDPTISFSNVNDGGCAILFTGGGRFGADPAGFPGSPDSGPPNRYGAGTFEFMPLESFPAPTGGIANNVPAGTVGNQNFGGPLGMDFDVRTAIKVTRLGVFDSASDGLGAPITARLYFRETQAELLHLDFTPDDPGELVEGSRFKDVVPPFSLSPGFKGTIVGQGYGDLELNGNLGPDSAPWFLDGGGCAIAFRGGGRFGDVPGAFPPNVDGGPPNRYAAGTFEFEIDTNPPPPPPEPAANLIASAGDGKVDLTWDPSAGPTPAVKYRVFRAASLAGAFTQIAEVTVTSHTDSPLPNEVPVCYSVRAVSAGGVESFDSLKRCEVPVGPPPAGRFIAYKVQPGVHGNQAYGGALGMDFDVTAAITITRLGVFDDGSDGLTVPLTARIFDRDSLAELALVSFARDDPGALIDGSRFKALDPPLDLLEGFHGTVSGSGYGGGERNGNQGVSPLDGLSTDDGGCRLSFVGGGRFGNDPNAFPDMVDGGPENRYAAGTFELKVLGVPIPPTAQPPTSVVAVSSGTSLVLTWTPPPEKLCILQPSGYRVVRSAAGGPFQPVADVTETSYTDSAVTAGTDYCYMVRSLGAGGQVSGDSSAACATPGRFIAYVVPTGTEGSQIDEAPVAMDFDVKLDIQVTRIGAFDSLGDGLTRPITVRIFDRVTEAEVVSMEFSPEDPGLLLNSSRFKPLVPPLALPAGFKGTILAEGYGPFTPLGSPSLLALLRWTRPRRAWSSCLAAAER